MRLNFTSLYKLAKDNYANKRVETINTYVGVIEDKLDKLPEIIKCTSMEGCSAYHMAHGVPIGIDKDVVALVRELSILNKLKEAGFDVDVTLTISDYVGTDSVINIYIDWGN
jgi:hypothetical protein